MVAISAFLPQRKKLFRDKDEDGNKLECPYPGMEDIYVTVVPPDWKTDNDRMAIDDITVAELIIRDIWSTFGGTNMVLSVPVKVDGRVQWEEDEDGNLVPKTEEVEFDVNMTKDEFYSAMDQVPSAIIDYWYARVMEVVPQWQPRFRSE